MADFPVPNFRYLCVPFSIVMSFSFIKFYKFQKFATVEIMGKSQNRNPADVFRKQQKLKEQKKLKKEREFSRGVAELLKNPDKIEEEIQKVQKQSDENRLDKRYKDRLKELHMMKSVALKKQELAGHGKSDATSKAVPTSSSAFDKGSVDGIDLNRRPEESVYFHPLYNPSGAPPVGKPMLYKAAPTPAQLQFNQAAVVPQQMNVHIAAGQVPSSVLYHHTGQMPQPTINPYSVAPPPPPPRYGSGIPVGTIPPPPPRINTTLNPSLPAAYTSLKRIMPPSHNVSMNAVAIGTKVDISQAPAAMPESVATMSEFSKALETVPKSVAPKVDTVTEEKVPASEGMPKQSALSMFASYGSDDDSDNDSEQGAAKPTDNTDNSSAIPVPLTTPPVTVVAAPIAIPNVAAPLAGVFPNGSVSASKAAPKRIKADSAITAFVPTHIKRNAIATTKRSKPIPAPVAPPPPSASATVNSNSVEADYENFMKEINQIIS